MDYVFVILFSFINSQGDLDSNYIDKGDIYTYEQYMVRCEEYINSYQGENKKILTIDGCKDTFEKGWLTFRYDGIATFKDRKECEVALELISELKRAGRSKIYNTKMNAGNHKYLEVIDSNSENKIFIRCKEFGTERFFNDGR